MSDLKVLQKTERAAGSELVGVGAGSQRGEFIALLLCPEALFTFMPGNRGILFHLASIRTGSSTNLGYGAAPGRVCKLTPSKKSPLSDSHFLQGTRVFSMGRRAGIPWVFLLPELGYLQIAIQDQVMGGRSPCRRRGSAFASRVEIRAAIR